MAATFDSSSTSNHSPPTTDNNPYSPEFPRINIAPPWSHIVRGGPGGDTISTSAVNHSPSSPSPSQVTSLSDQITSGSSTMAATSVSSPPLAPAQPQPVDNLNSAIGANCVDEINGNAARPKKPAWKKPLNGIIEPVIDASWPPLSKSSMGPSKVSTDSSNAVADGSSSSSSSSQASATSNSSPRQKQGSSYGKLNSGTNQNMSNRQRFMKRGGGGIAGAVRPPVHSTLPHPPLSSSSPFQIFQMPPSNYAASDVLIPSGKELPFGINTWDARPDFRAQSHRTSDQGSSSRRGSFRPHARRDATYHDGANFPNNRNGRVYQPRGSLRGLVRPPLPPPPPPTMAPPSMGSFVSPIGFPDVYYLPTVPVEPYRGMPFFAHGPPPAMFTPVVESPVAFMLINQIEYYFSDANLAGDQFLKSKMDQQGWVPITLIASFPRVKNLTVDIQFILDSLRSSIIVEVNEDRVRRRTDWMKWIQPDSSEVLPSEPDHTNLAATLLNVVLDESTDKSGSDPNLEASQETCSVESSIQLQLAKGNVM